MVVAPAVAQGVPTLTCDAADFAGAGELDVDALALCKPGKPGRPGRPGKPGRPCAHAKEKKAKATMKVVEARLLGVRESVSDFIREG